MYSTYSNDNRRPELKEIILNAIKSKNKTHKKHSDCLNCLINCAEYRFILQVINNSKKGNNIFFIQEKENLSTPLFFYNISSNEIIEKIEKKNISENFLNVSQKIKSESEIDKDYEQNKKNKILLFNYIKFPLINICSELNNNRESTLIILDNGNHDIVSNRSINSYSVASNNCCSLLFDIKSISYLFSINDIKDSSEIKIKFNGNIHGQQLIKEDAICIFSPDLIINSIQSRMKKVVYSKDKQIKNNLNNKYFFTQIYDKNRNNFGLLFSFKKNKDINSIKFDSESIMKENFIIIKIFFCVDMWINTNINNIRETNDTSDTSSNCSKIKIEYHNNEAEKYHKYKTFNNNYVFYNSNKFDDLNNYENYNSDNRELNNYYTENKTPFYVKNNNNCIDNKYYEKTYYNYSSPQNYNYYNLNEDTKYPSYNTINNDYTKYPSYNAINNEESNNNNNNENYYYNENYDNYENTEYIGENSFKEDYEYYELNTLLNNIDLLKKDEDLKILPKEENIILFNNENININKSIFIDLKNELIKEIFSKYNEDNCISNYVMARKRIELNMNIEKEKLKRIKLKYYFDCFKNINNMTTIIPYINEKGKLFFTEICPSLSSIRLVLKAKNNVIKKLKSQKAYGFNIRKVKKDIIIIEYEKNKSTQERDLLYFKMNEIIKIIGDNKLSFKNILYDKSYFCVLWNFTESQIIHSSFLAYYSFDFKLIGIFIINLNIPQWFSSFSYNVDFFKDYKKEYNKNEEEAKAFLKNLSIDKGDGQYRHFYTYDYMRYTQSYNPK